MDNIANQHLAELVRQDYRRARVFEKYRLDFCCGGNVPLADACDRKKVSLDLVVEDLGRVTADPVHDPIEEMNATQLIRHIENVHHRYVEETAPPLLAQAKKVAAVHGQRCPEMVRVHELFSEAVGNLAQHMKKEELVLFPLIRRMEQGELSEADDLRTLITSAIGMMEMEHDAEGARLNEIAELTNGYDPDCERCNTFEVLLKGLAEFEADLHRHVHLENNILFPMARRLMGQNN